MIFFWKIVKFVIQVLQVNSWLVYFIGTREEVRILLHECWVSVCSTSWRLLLNLLGSTLIRERSNNHVLNVVAFKLRTLRSFVQDLAMPTTVSWIGILHRPSTYLLYLSRLEYCALMRLQMQRIVWTWHWHLGTLLHGFVVVNYHGRLIITSPDCLSSFLFLSTTSTH